MQIYAFYKNGDETREGNALPKYRCKRRRISCLLHHNAADEAVRARTETYDEAALTEHFEIH